MIGKVLRSTNVEHKNWKQALYKFLRNYRTTPHTTTEKSTSEIIFPNRMFKIRIPDFIDNKDKVKDKDISTRIFRKKRKEDTMLTNEIMRNHATLILEIKLLLQNDKGTRLYLPMIKILILFTLKKVV